MKFGYALLYVEDVEKTVLFYESAFGQERKMIHEGGYAELDTGATTLGFVARAVARENGVVFSESSSASPAPPMEIAFVTDDVAAAFQRAVDAGASPVAEPKDKPWGQTVAYVRDPNGFLIELCSAIADA